MVVRFQRTPRTRHHRCSAPAKLLIVLLALLHSNAQSKRPASFGRVGIRHHRAQTPRRVLSPGSNRATTDRADSCTPLQPRYEGPLLVVLIEGPEKTLFEMQRLLSRCGFPSIDRSLHGRIHLPTVIRIYASVSNPTMTSNRIFRTVLFVFVTPAVVPVHTANSRARPFLFAREHVFFAWLDVTFSCIDFVFAFLSTYSSFEFLFSPDRTCVRLLLIRCSRTPADDRRSQSVGILTRAGLVRRATEKISVGRSKFGPVVSECG